MAAEHKFENQPFMDYFTIPDTWDIQVYLARVRDHQSPKAGFCVCVLGYSQGLKITTLIRFQQTLDLRIAVNFCWICFIFCLFETYKGLVVNSLTRSGVSMVIFGLL